MALFNCPECNKVISDKAKLCVCCGAPVIIMTSKIIGTPIKIFNLEFTEYDFPSQMSWFYAKEACESLGHGWRLPTKNELDYFYNIYGIKGYSYNLYWSSSEGANDVAYYYDFAYGSMNSTSKNFTFYVRAVRDF